MRQSYKKGDVVRIKSGDFASFTGEVEEVNAPASVLKVLVHIFNKGVTVEVSTVDAEKVPPGFALPPKLGGTNN